MDLVTIFSFLISALSVLVVFLIGWQIYSVINMRKEIDNIRSEVIGVVKRVDLECSKLNLTVYYSLFDEIRKKREDVYGYFNYGLLVIMYAENYGDIPLCLTMIKALIESFPATKPVGNVEKANLLLIASKISNSSLRQNFGELHGMLITKLPSKDQS